MTTLIPGISLGIYEKALPADLDWPGRLASAARAGFDFLEMSIDPSQQRLSRLDWSWKERIELRHQIEDAGLWIHSICLSAHREQPLGSNDREMRQRGLQIMHKAIELAFDLGIRLIQVAGYDTYNEPGSETSRQLYRDGLTQAVNWASQAGVLLGLENQEYGYVDSISTAVELVKDIDSPYLGLYSDVGNLIVNGLDVASEIQVARGKLFGVHVKDALPGIPRRVPLGTGQVPFNLIFKQLFMIRFRGVLTLEMWNDESLDAEQVSSQSCKLIKEYLEKAWQSTSDLNRAANPGHSCKRNKP